MYKLYTDKNKTFSCNVDIEGASLNESEARIILETNAVNLLYNGKIKSDGTCEVDISKIKLIPENTKGTIKLEIIAENTLFVAWESDFIVETEKKVRISEVKEDVSKNKNKNNISVIVEVDESKEVPSNKELKDIFTPDNRLSEHITFLKGYAAKHGLANTIKNDNFFENYKKVLQKKNVILSESDIKYIKNKVLG